MGLCDSPGGINYMSSGTVRVYAGWLPRGLNWVLIGVIGLLCPKGEATEPRKFVLQNEMSEHCRRHVVSSIFLGRQVADSSAEVMHFSRLDLPYSCSINVRTESGSNIILVILSKSERSVITSCAQGHDQLLVYEMGETFGGYWGVLPESVFQQEPRNRSTYYTLQTTESLSGTADTGMTDYDTLNYTKEIVSLTTPQDGTEGNYVVMEVPLVNVSGNLELGKTEVARADENELFDLIYDVTPKNGVLYETSVMPLVQFSIWKQKGQNPWLEETEPRYQLDYNAHGFTQDYRLMSQRNSHKRKFSNRPHYSTRRLRFMKKKKELFSVNNWSGRIYPQTDYITELITTRKLNNGEFKNLTDPWQLIDNYLKLLNVNSLTTSPENMDDEVLTLLKKISNMKNNSSVYLHPNLSKYSDLYLPSMTKKKNFKTNKIIKNFITRVSLSTLPFRNNEENQSTNSTYNASISNDMPTPKVKLEISANTTLSTRENYLRKFTSAETLPSIIHHQEKMGVQSTPLLYSRLEHFKGAITEKRRKSGSGSLVDHESWENIVQVAPVMADLLNVTTADIHEDITYISKKVRKYTPENKINRKKRYIQALSFDHHRPCQIITKEDVHTPEPDKDMFDSHHLAEIVELQDDEIQGRVALHYFKNYVGPTIFNMCDFNEPKVREVYLINSSRIIIAINNFTMDRITIVMTESRVARATGCPPAHLECQVSGVRVCVHTMNACDGLPNCGTYDIYDEDRLLCGNSVGFHYTVCLAACTFLMLLLTLLYCVHYWLKRCVPKVSQAFFVYTDKSENILYLDSIMRPPNDFDGGSQLVYHSSFFDDDDLSTESPKDDDRKLMNIVRRCLRFLFCKKPNLHSDADKGQQECLSSIYIDPKRKFSFTEAELRKIGPINTRNASIQTGDSLEIKNHSTLDNSVKQKMKKGSSIQSERELTTLRRVRSISATLQSNSKNSSAKKLEQNAKKYPVPVAEEVELRNTMYEGKRPLLDRHSLERTKYDIHPESSEQRRTATKHLRFEEATTTVDPSVVDLQHYEDVDGRRRIILNTDKLTNLDLDAIEEHDETVSNSGRDFRRFWSKGKKKKTQLSIR